VAGSGLTSDARMRRDSIDCKTICIGDDGPAGQKAGSGGVRRGNSSFQISTLTIEWPKYSAALSEM
jgi:hypothetical protein